MAESAPVDPAAAWRDAVAGYQIELCNAGFGGECQLSVVCLRCPPPPVQHRGNWVPAEQPGLTVFTWDDIESQTRRGPLALPLLTLVDAINQHEAAAHG